MERDNLTTLNVSVAMCFKLVLAQTLNIENKINLFIVLNLTFKLLERLPK